MQTGSHTSVKKPVGAFAKTAGLLLILLFAIVVLLLLLNPGSPFQVVEQVSGHPEKRLPDSTVTHQVTVRAPAGPPTVKSGLTDAHGHAVTIACNTCHATRPPNVELKLSQPPLVFHQGLKGSHGNLTCVSCHNSQDGYQSLRLADGKSVSYPDVMQLCAQCHGPQYRDYQHGAHGGMTGYWDLSRGSRQRNNCIDCHDAHTPKYPQVIPAPGPVEGGSRKKTGQAGAGHG